MPRFFTVFLLLALSLIATGPSANAQGAGGTDALRVMPETAIPFTGFLSKQEFDTRFPGTAVAAVADLDDGWYVIYEHASIRYYFGPILLESTGKDYLSKLEAILGKAVDQRPSIQDYSLRLSYEPSQTRSSPTAPGGAPSDPSSPSQPGQNSTPPKPSIFDFFKRLFGFR